MTKVPSMKEAIFSVSWPTPIPPTALDHIVKPELLDDPRIQYFEAQERFLVQMLHDMILDDSLRHPKPGTLDAELRDYSLDFDDAVFSTLRQLLSTGVVSTVAVFAAQISWDIHEICRGGSSMSKLLTFAQKGYKDSFIFFINAAGTLNTGDLRWLTKDVDLLIKLYRRINLHLGNEVFPRLKQLALNGSNKTSEPFDGPPEDRASWEAENPVYGANLRKFGNKRLRAVMPSPDTNSLLDANKLNEGTLLLDVASMAEEAGVNLANHHLSIFVMAHLYNALHQLKVFDLHWPELDRIIDIHAGAIFVKEIPRTPKDIVARYTYRTGLPTTNWRRIASKEPWQFTPTAATQALRAFFSSKTTLPRLLYELSSQAATRDRTFEAGNGPKVSRSQDRRLQLTPRNTLAKIEQYMDAVLPDLLIDYVPLTRRCYAFFRRLRERLGSQLGVKYPTVTGFAGETGDPAPLIVAWGILLDTKEIKDKIKSKKKKQPRRR